MRRHRTLVLALLLCTAIGASSQNAYAQLRTNNRYAQNTPPPMTRSTAEELPAGRPAPGQMSTQMPMSNDSGGYVDGNFAPGQYYPDGPAGACAGACGCSDPSCDACNNYPCGEPCCQAGCGDSCDSGGCGSSLWGCGGSGGQWFVHADYLAVRAHFSDALSWVEQIDTTDVTESTTTQIFHQFDFDYKSSFRIGGGYRLCCCGEEIDFNFTRFTSSADDFVTAPDRNSGRRVAVPFNPFPDPGPPPSGFLNPDTPQSARMRANVDVNSYDLEWRKTIPLGGTSCSDCGNPCGCGDSCGRCNKCPAWDITWSGGIRGANVDWDRAYFVIDPETPDNDTQTRSELTFDGAGPRFGVEGRRYFGRDGWFSIFMKGDISLLFGQLDLNTVRHSIVNEADSIITESLHTQQIIPVTEIETGITATVTCHSTFSAGYILSAWHDLGFRDEPVLPTQVPTIITHYDDANIMSFDGFFARYEFAY